MGPVSVEVAEKMEVFDEQFSLSSDRKISCDVNNKRSETVADDKDKVNGNGMKYLHMLEAALGKTTHNFSLVKNLQEKEEDKVSGLERDACVTNLRCLHLFYGFSPETFALGVSLLDRFICKVKVRPKYLSCIATACYFIALKTEEEDVDIPHATELVFLSQCGGSERDLLRMESIILDKLDWDLNATTSLSFLDLFYAIFVEKFPELQDCQMLESMVSKMDVCMCHYGFYAFQFPTLALAMLSCVLQEKDAGFDVLSAVVDMQEFCNISDFEFLQCRGMIIDFLVIHYTKKSQIPRKKMPWIISRRTMAQLRPTEDYMGDLPTIDEDMLETDECDDDNCETSYEETSFGEEDGAESTLPI